MDLINVTYPHEKTNATHKWVYFDFKRNMGVPSTNSNSMQKLSWDDPDLHQNIPDQ